LVTQAGFIDLPPQPSAAVYPARMFYVFEPADDDAAHKPLAVFFNGGPGFPTSLGFFAYGTGRMTLDAFAPAGSPPTTNPARWTAFANLLYLDERQAGFSYGLGGGPPPQCVGLPVEDASDFVRALLSFLDSHPAIQANPVLLVAESWGGTRATWMLDLLLRYATDASMGGSDLQAVIQAHYDSVFPDYAGAVLDEATVARQFAGQVLVEPQVTFVQRLVELPLVRSDPYVGSVDLTKQDQYAVNQPRGWSDGLNDGALRVWSTASTAASMLGVELSAIGELQPEARTGAFHPLTESVPDSVVRANLALTALLGPLQPGDCYIVFDGHQCPSWPALAVPAAWVSDPAAAVAADPDHQIAAFIANLRHVRTFITHARYDILYAPAIPYMLGLRGLGGQIDSSPRTGVQRPGWFTVDLPATTDGASAEPAKIVEVRFPEYTTSGHMVAAMQPADLLSDVDAWWSGP
jgi:hypothetical protein